MHSEKENKKGVAKFLANHTSRTRFVLIVMVILVVFATALFAQSLQRQLYEQRSYSLGQTTEKIVQLTNNVINNEWDRLEYASHELARQPQATRQTLLTRLADFYDIDTELHNWKLGAIDSNGSFYRWDGSMIRWSAPDILLNDPSSYQITILEDRSSTGEQMAFVYCLPEPIALTGEDVVLTHTVLILDMATFEENLQVSAFEESSFSYITQENGTRVYHQQNQNEFISAYNIMTALEHTEFLYGGSHQELLSASDSGSSYIAEIEKDGEKYFLSYTPLSVNDWGLFLFVPEANVGGNATHVISRLTMQVAGIAGLLIIIIVLFVRNNSRQTLAKQQIAVDEARRANQAKSDFLSHMSHDMRTPLNGIMGMCHIAEQHKEDQTTVADCLSKIDISSRQLMALINDVLDMSRIEQDKVEVNTAPVDLMNIIRSCTVNIEFSVYEKEIDFQQHIEELAHPVVLADSLLVEKILTNILGNSAKFTPHKGRIVLSVWETEETDTKGMYHFKVEDTGVGMSPEFLAHLFEPFSQERVGSRTKYQGTGLGLSIVKSLIDRLGGTIQVDSVLGEGSVFYISLPLDYSSREVLEETEAAQDFDGTGLHVLLVEDNDLNLTIAQTILEECGLTVDTASDGAAALEHFQNSDQGYYDMIIMDVRMPVMDGLEASRRIRALDRKDAGTVPIIALTADALSGDMEKTRQAGMNDHLGKPIDIDKLHAVLRMHCSDK